jgi:microcompartment protein CcmL/EutN
MIDVDQVKAAIDPAEIRKQAIRVLIDNQECLVAQWIIQNPFEQISDYMLEFKYHDEASPEHGYTVKMVKIK